MLLSTRSLPGVCCPRRPNTTLQLQDRVLLCKASASVDYKKDKKHEGKDEASKDVQKLMKRLEEAKKDDKEHKSKIKAERKEEKEDKKDKEEKKHKEEKKEKEVKAEMKSNKEPKMEEPMETPEAKMERKAMKAERKRLIAEAEARGALYALHWVVAPKAVAQEASNTVAASAAAGMAGDPTAPAKQFISSLQMDLKRMEKVAKDAVWYLTKEAEDGLHVVLVTANAKHAAKHELAELGGAADTHVLSLGAAGEVEVPVATLRSLVLAQREESSDSDSEGEEEKMGKGDSKDAKTSLPGHPAGIHVEGDVDAAIAAALASLGTTGESNELDSDAATQYPPFRSFL